MDPEQVANIRESKKLSGSNFAAIKYAIILGREIQQRFPQIAEDYRADFTMAKLAKKYKLTSRYDITKRTARSVICYALKGFKGKASIEPYAGLITDPEELMSLALKHQKSSLCVLLKNKKGIYGQTKKYQQESGRRLAVSQGKKIVTKKEVNLVLKLSELSEYQTSRGFNAQKIAEKVNKKIHKGVLVRSNRQITKIILKSRKKQHLIQVE
jgi:hypothetical protein